MNRDAAYLLDSHALLWWWFDPDRLSTAVRELYRGCCRPMASRRCRSPWRMGCGPAVTASPTAIRLIACWLPRPNWIAWCCSPPIPSFRCSLAKPSGEAPSSRVGQVLAFLGSFVGLQLHSLLATEEALGDLGPTPLPPPSPFAVANAAADGSWR